mmetsp:Transcript_4339/g.9760  ORF Transcript_4339/g.9760 Transcript_4339/m.9760 type:complete len:218 (-) Transcript_4339:100-753(-)
MHALPEVDDSVRVSQRCGRGPPFSLEKTMTKVATTSSPGLATFVTESPTTQTLDQVATRLLFDSGPAALAKHCVLVQPIPRQIINLGLVDQRLRDSRLLRLVGSPQDAVGIVFANFSAAERTARKRTGGPAVAFLLLDPSGHAGGTTRVIARKTDYTKARRRKVGLTAQRAKIAAVAGGVDPRLGLTSLTTHTHVPRITSTATITLLPRQQVTDVKD